MIILSKNRLHHWILRGWFSLFSHENRRSTDLRFLSVVGVFPYFRHFPFSSWNSDIGTWKSRICDVTENFQAPIRNHQAKVYPIPWSNLRSVRCCPLRGHPMHIPGKIVDSKHRNLEWLYQTTYKTIRLHWKNLLFNIDDCAALKIFFVSDSFDFSPIRKRVWSGCRRCLFVS